MANNNELETIHGAPDWDSDWKIVSLLDCQNLDFNEHSEDKVLLGLLISIRHYTEGAAYQSMANKQPINGTSGPPSKQPRTYFKSKSATYDRIFTFCCLNSPGQCFNVISHNSNQSDMLMRYGKSHSSIGDIFAIIEPDTAISGMQNVLTVTTKEEFVPIKWKDTLIPSVALVPPPKGHQRYFILKNKKVDLFKVGAVQASCKGQLCDRQKKPSRNIACGCLYMLRASDVVFEGHVKFSYEDASGKSVSHTVLDHRSFRTTNIFIKPIQMGADILPFFQRRKDIRIAVKTITDIINDNEGWTIIGWYRKGEVEDASAPANENDSKIEGFNKPIHIAYLYPTKPTRVLSLIEDKRFDSTAPQQSNSVAVSSSTEEEQ